MDHEWKNYDAVFRRPILIDGTRAARFSQLMRRMLPDGSWEYRAMTSRELGEEQDDLAW